MTHSNPSWSLQIRMNLHRKPAPHCQSSGTLLTLRQQHNFGGQPSVLAADSKTSPRRPTRKSKAQLVRLLRSPSFFQRHLPVPLPLCPGSSLTPPCKQQRELTCQDWMSNWRFQIMT